MSGVPGLSPCRRYITSHLADGQSVYTQFDALQFFSIPKLGEMTRSYSINADPAKLEGDVDLKAYKALEGRNSHRVTEIVAPGGANVNVVDFEPGGTSVLHQTVSIDFSICTNGVLDHELDSGEIVRLYPGDHIIQRGTMHKWTNVSKTNPARLVAVVLSCEPFMVASNLLKEVHIPHSD